MLEILAGRDRGGVKFHCLLSAVNTANCAQCLLRAATRSPLDPTRAVKIQNGQGSGATQGREVQSMYYQCIMGHPSKHGKLCCLLRVATRPPLDPTRAVKIHGRGSGATQTKTNIMERNSFKETHAKEQKRQPPS